MIEDIFRRYSSHVEFIGDAIEDVHQIGAYGSQVIHLAAFSNNCDDVVELLEHGADLHAIGDLGLTPLHYAVLGGACDVVRLLVLRGGRLNVQNEFGETPIEMAHIMGYEDIEKLLRDLGSVTIFGTDDATRARERWFEFKSIQEENFGSD